MASGNMGQPSAKVSTSDVSVIAQNMRTFRILRSLKMVSRFQKVRLIVLAVTKAFQVGHPLRVVTSYVVIIIIIIIIQFICIAPQSIVLLSCALFICTNSS